MEHTDPVLFWHLHRTLGGGSRDQSVHVEKGHCHVSIPKLEVLLDLNDVSGTKDQLATLLQRVGRRNRKVCFVLSSN